MECNRATCSNVLSDKATSPVCLHCRRMDAGARHRLKVGMVPREARKRPTKEERKAWYDGLKGGPCMDCGQVFPACAMDWDHRPGEIKTFGVGHGLNAARSTLLREIAKCDLVCANCHRVRTWLRRAQ